MRTASTEHIAIRHPTPDLLALHVAQAKNVSRLERSAEELSQGGSDIGDEIRKMQQEQRASEESRRSSIVSRELQAPRSRNASTSSYANSIVDVNKEARWGGYSPAGFISSPSLSLHSGSWSHVQRNVSTHSSMRPEPAQEGRPLDSPLASPPSIMPSRRPSQSSLAQSFLPDDENVWGHETNSLKEEVEDEPLDVEHEQEMKPEEEQEYRPSTPPDRPPSSDTFRQARSLFHDFDGVHFSPVHEEFVELDNDGNETRRVSLQDVLDYREGRDRQEEPTPRARPVSYAQPLPGKNMVYYPAPVPRMLNLPKRLSKLPSASVQSQRRSQALSPVTQEVRKSTAWLPTLDFQGEEPEVEEETPVQDAHTESQGSPQKPVRRKSDMLQSRSSMMSLHNSRSMAALSSLPPQLRASVFFEHQPVEHNIEIKSESAVATLDSILAASATAPVSAFTHHPFAGDVARDVYARDIPTKRHTMLIADAKNTAMDKDLPQDPKRSTMSGFLGRRRSTDMATLQRRTSAMSMFTDLGKADGKRIQKSKSRMSLGSEFSLNPARQLPDEHGNLADDVQYAAQVPLPSQDVDLEEDQEHVEFDGQLDDEPDPVFAQPSTLLAELQLRKAQQKTRNRNAGTAFPNGMHSTLLELDAVAQIEKAKRKNGKVALAWEDTSMQAQQETELDEDVPLGVLYSAKVPSASRGRLAGAASDWDRPLGLIERRQMEDNEPLSSRRMRLRGEVPSTVAQLRDMEARLTQEQTHVDPENLDESIAARPKQESVLDLALGDVTKGDGGFVGDALSQFGVQDTKAAAEPMSEEAPEEETLGQRRTRLQREREARKVSDPAAAPTAARPPIRSSNSLANLLAAHPTGPYAGVRNAKEPAPGSLLSSNQQHQAEAKRKLVEQNVRSMSYTARGQPQQMQYTPQPANIFSGLQTSASMPMGVNNQNGYFGHAAMQMGAGYPTMVNPLAYQTFAAPAPTVYGGMQGFPMQSQVQLPYAPAYVNMGGHGYGNMTMPMGYPMQAGFGGVPSGLIEQDQRTNIDRWRSSVAQ